MAIRKLKAAAKKTEKELSELRETVSRIIDKVRKEGDEALRYYEKLFDDFEPDSFRVPPEELAKAGSKLPPEIIEELDFAIEKVGAFAEAQKKCLTDLDVELYPGMRMGHRVVPVESCGCYVPAGRYPCLTSAVMWVMPAKIAGVKRIVVCSPPGREGMINLGIQYTLHKMGVEEVY